MKKEEGHCVVEKHVLAFVGFRMDLMAIRVIPVVTVDTWGAHEDRIGAATPGPSSSHHAGLLQVRKFTHVPERRIFTCVRC